MDDRKALLKTIAGLEARLADLQARLPAHSIPPSMIAEWDELDEELAEARAKLMEENISAQNTDDAGLSK
jgi:hypothetical protein